MARRKKEEKVVEGSVTRRIPIEWHIPDDMIGRYATNLIVQHTDNEFVIWFFEVDQPIVLGTPEEVERQLQEVTSVRGRCIAKIIVANNRMRRFIEVLEQNWKRFQEIQGGEPQ